MKKTNGAVKNAYPILLTLDGGGYTVYIPDFGIGTQGDTMADAIEMARDAIGLMGIDLEDDGKPLPAPRSLRALPKTSEDDILTLVDVDFTE